mmetsp:Transcript_28943/g.81510  ORF Transcript_28943/g.81510 Transcript_28943/m.81510 type:complete len:271 (-) Transcript_28943:478-1290(-)|eukprot:CAMPEP_0117656928 /NCGR_PEP_ID=MMETSP0804-20121206/5061_1 /TAXON_ID=1074897 /ORGANISM="Tetraselmis astigmatica, Strain CCMP880" /LENGTH=270 /DNA_ID=CAMNT_0005463353 /DNA_START=288 /DNA_END=1100 /DNA_ORIENTATION=+
MWLGICRNAAKLAPLPSYIIHKGLPKGPITGIAMPDWLTELGNRKRSAHTAAYASNSTGGSTKSRAEPQLGQAGVNDLGDGALVVYCPGAIPLEDCAHLMESLQKDVKWASRKIKIMGKEVMQPRLVAYMANDTTQEYTYSGAKFMPDPWDPYVLKIKEEVEKHTGGDKFNSCLLNNYRNGSDYIGWHSDDESLYGKNATIGSVSFGAPRDFVMRRRADHSDKLVFKLGPGDILIMKGTTQTHWAHCIPKRTRLKEPRINLTFRQIIDGI